MSDRIPVKATGAPIRILFLAGMIWIAIRIFWSADITALFASKDESRTGERKYSAVSPLSGYVRFALGPVSSVDIGWNGHGELAELDSGHAAALPQDNRMQRGKPIIGDSLSLVSVIDKDAMYSSGSTQSDPGQNNTVRNFLSETEYYLAEPEPRSEKAKVAMSTNNKVKPSGLSGYFWLFARKGASQASIGELNIPFQPGFPQYGGSQAGSILTYRVVGGQSRNLSVYSRVSKPLSGTGAGEIAIGTRIKPVKNVPVSLYAERRYREGVSNKHGTALFLAGGSGPDDIVKGVFLETYGQVGYLFQEDQSYFFDGSIAVKKKVANEGVGQIAIGAAAWTGGQKGVRRFDVGPRITVGIPLGSITTQASADWRQRIAGNAEPGSGLTISLTASF